MHKNQCETLQCGAQPRPGHKGVLGAQAEQLLMSSQGRTKAFLLHLCNDVILLSNHKLPLSFSYLKTPKQAWHALLLLALQSHHSDRYLFELLSILVMGIYLQTSPVVEK